MDMTSLCLGLRSFLAALRGESRVRFRSNVDSSEAKAGADYRTSGGAQILVLEMT